MNPLESDICLVQGDFCVLGKQKIVFGEEKSYFVYNLLSLEEKVVQCQYTNL